MELEPRILELRGHSVPPITMWASKLCTYCIFWYHIFYKNSYKICRRKINCNSLLISYSRDCLAAKYLFSVSGSLFKPFLCKTTCSGWLEDCIEYWINHTSYNWDFKFIFLWQKAFKEPIYLLNMGPISVSTTLLHFKKLQIFWSLLIKSLPNFVHPKMMLHNQNYAIT